MSNQLTDFLGLEIFVLVQMQEKFNFYLENLKLTASLDDHRLSVVMISNRVDDKSFSPKYKFTITQKICFKLFITNNGFFFFSLDFSQDFVLTFDNQSWYT